MKITEVEAFDVRNRSPSLGGRYFTFVKLTTDDGVVSYGDPIAAGERLATKCEFARLLRTPIDWGAG